MGASDNVGDTEPDWAAAWECLPIRKWDPPRRRTVVVAPHPDDEVLGCGALIARQRRRGIEVLVLAVTDGEAAFDRSTNDAPDPNRAIKAPANGPTERVGLAARRRDEQVSACWTLGVPAASVVRLRLPDGQVADHEAALSEAIGGLLQTGDLVVAPWPGDHHCDHEASGRAVVGPAARSGALLIGSLVWGPLHSPPPDANEMPLLGLQLQPGEGQQRWRALRCHRTQLGDPHHDPVVTPDLAAHLHRSIERYVPVCQ